MITRFPFFIHPQSDPARGKIQLCHNLIVNILKKRPYKQEFPEITIERQTLDHYLKVICNIRS